MPTEYVVTSKYVFTSEETIDDARPMSLVISGDKIIDVSDPEQIAQKYPQLPVRDFGDNFICPGFHDAHVHFFHTAVFSSPLAWMELGENEDTLARHVGEFAKTLPEGQWAVCQGWRSYRWNPVTRPTKASLDRYMPDRPCAMCSGDGHTLWLNSEGLRRLGLDKDSVPPEGGWYDKDETGELTGVIHEAAYMELMPRIIDTLPKEKVVQAYKDQLNRMLAYGITSFCDVSLMPHPGCDFVHDEIYDQIQADGDMHCRAHLFPTLLEKTNRLEKLQAKYEGNAYLAAPGFKQFFDGVSSEHTAYLLEPYTNARFEGDRGQLTIPFEQMRSMVLAAAQKHQAVRIHVIGDGAIHAALDIFEEAYERFGEPVGGRNTLEHLENLLPSDIDRLRACHCVASCQPGHITLDPGGPERDLGPERVECMWPFKTYLEKGVLQAFGTDSPITKPDSMNVLYCAVTRQDPYTHLPEGGWTPAQKISMADALRIYTVGSARVVRREHELGTLEAGKLADFVVLNQNLLDVPAEKIQQTQVLHTFVGGEEVYSA